MKEEPNYCFDTASGALDCATQILPLFVRDMLSPDFPWYQAFQAILMFLVAILF